MKEAGEVREACRNSSCVAGYRYPSPAAALQHAVKRVNKKKKATIVKATYCEHSAPPHRTEARQTELESQDNNNNFLLCWQQLCEMSCT